MNALTSNNSPMVRKISRHLCYYVAIPFLFLAVSSVALADPWPNPADGDYPNIYDSVNLLTGSSYTSNSQLESIYIENDDLWSDLEVGIAVIGYSAGYSNTLGLYDPDSIGNQVDVTTGISGFGLSGDGSAGNPFTFFSASESGNFGWLLTSRLGDRVVSTWYSESSYNSGGNDHMLTFSLGDSITFYGEDSYGNVAEYTFDSPYLITWEDMNMGDEDYNDIMYVVNANVSQVPEPATILLFGAGLAGMSGIMRKRKK